ncbi:hypothetical protein [Mycoplasmopsis sturni]|uniref:hypothetical protein n=1 Tax=Mycoplasmopsis sturni TaxID=39047 RepID=UPI0005624BE7|nr:hypothetical protein [Mycoplasmopsis sturni]
MKRKFWKSLIPLSIAGVTFVSVSCTTKQEDPQKSSLKDLELITLVLNNTPLEIKKPKVKLPDSKSSLSDYTAEALDCMNDFYVNNIHSNQNRVELVGTILSVYQQVGNTKAEIGVQWKIKGRTATFPQFYEIDGFKKIPLWHNHYVRSSQKIPDAQCLNNYNYNIVTDNIKIVSYENYSKIAYEYSQNSLDTLIQNTLDSIVKKTNFENNEYNWITSFDIPKTKLEAFHNKIQNLEKPTLGQVQILINEFLGEISFERFQNVQDQILVKTLSDVESIVKENEELLENLHPNVIYFLTLKLYVNQNLNKTYAELTDSMLKSWVYNEFLAIANFENYPDKVEKLEYLIRRSQ